MNSEPQPVQGVLISRDDAADCVQAISYLQSLIAAQRDGTTLGQKFVRLRENLTKAAYAQSDNTERTQETRHSQREYLKPTGLVDTNTAAQLLGCGAANVRDLIRRHVITGYRVGNRWLIEETEVQQRRERRKHGATQY